MNKEDILRDLSHITEPDEAGSVRNIGVVLAVLNGIGVIGAIILAIQSGGSRYTSSAVVYFIGLAIGLGFMAFVNLIVFNAFASIVASTYRNAQATIIQAKYLILNSKEEAKDENKVVNNSMPLL